MKKFTIVFLVCILFSLFGYENISALENNNYDNQEVIDSGVCGDNISWVLTADYKLILSGTGEMYDIDSTDTAPWDMYKKDIKEVYVNKGITSIGARAFKQCKSLVNIILPNGITKINYAAFEYCSLNNIELPETITHIDDYAFSGSSLNSISIPSSVKRIDDHAFMYCSQLSSITIPDNVEYLGKSAFYHCERLTDAYIGYGIKSIGSSLFGYCSNLKNVSIGSNVEYIYENAFECCTMLESLIIPDSVVALSSRAFSCCENLKEIVIPDSVTTIGEYAFVNCYSLEKVTIGKGLTNIKNNCFSGCKNLQEVIYRAKEENWVNIEIGENNEAILNAKIVFANEKLTTVFDKNGNSISIKCESDYFAENLDKTFVAKHIEIYEEGNSGTMMKKGLKPFLKFKLYVANKDNLDTKVDVKGNFSIRIPISSDYKNSTITVVHWVEGVPFEGSYTPKFDAEKNEYYIEFITTSFSQFDICINFGFEADSDTLVYQETKSIPATTDSGLSVIYTSSNPEIAAVDENGNVTATGKGIATITAAVELENGEKLEDTCEVTVVNSFEIPDDFSFTQSSLELIYNNTATLSTTADMVANVTYTSSNPKIVTVDGNGNLTTVGRGTATITASFTDDFGEVYEVTCEVTVKFTFWQWIIYILFLGFLWY